MTQMPPKRFGKAPQAPDLVASALDLTSADLNSLRAWQWDQLRDELARALGLESEGVINARVGVLVASDFDGTPPHELTPRALKRLQADVTTLLRVVSLQHRTPRVNTLRGFALRLDVAVLPKGDRSLLYVRGTVRDTLIYILQLALTQTTNRVVQQCVECPVLFPAAGKRRYCSRRCANLRNRRKWLARHSPEEIKAANRARYEQRVSPAKPQRYRTRRAPQ